MFEVIIKYSVSLYRSNHDHNIYDENYVFASIKIRVCNYCNLIEALVKFIKTINHLKK